MSEQIDAIIQDLNRGLRAVLDGQYIVFCSTIARAAQQLMNLKGSIDEVIKVKDKEIDALEETLRRLGHEVVNVIPEKEEI